MPLSVIKSRAKQIQIGARYQLGSEPRGKLTFASCSSPRNEHARNPIVAVHREKAAHPDCVMDLMCL